MVFRLYPPKVMRTWGTGPKEKMEDKQAAAQLADYSGDGRSTYPHVQPKDEHWVQGDVEHRPKHHRLHPLLGKALADDKLVHSVGQQGEYRAEQVVGVIVQSIGQGGLTGSEKQEQRPPGQQGTGHQEHRQHVKQEKAVCQYLSGLGQVTLAHSNGHQGGTADPYQKGHGADHGDHGTTDAGPARPGCRSPGYSRCRCGPQCCTAH